MSSPSYDHTNNTKEKRADESYKEEQENIEVEVINKSKSADLLLERKDQFGKRIKKGGKKHRITFIDQVKGEQLAEVHQVESYKRYNAFFAP